MRDRATFVDLDAAGTARGTVVIVDVLRAFTTAAVAFTRGARLIVLTDDSQHALSLRAQHRDWLLMGEEHGFAIKDFDLSNSPAALLDIDLTGRTIVHRSTSGTRSAVAATASATRVLCAALVCARRTAEALEREEPVTYVISGRSRDRKDIDDGDDDLAVAEYIEACRFGESDPDPVRERVARSMAARSLRNDGHNLADISVATSVDAFPMLMTVTVSHALPAIEHPG